MMINKVVICGVDTSILPKLSANELYELMIRLKKGDENAKNEFIYGNMRLVLSVVQRFVSRNENLDDLFQVGCVGLIKAINNFDLNLNVKFSTYAVPMIVGEIRRFLRDNSAIRVSRSLRDIAYRALVAREKLESKLSREPNIEEIAEELNLPIKQVAFAIDAITEPLSLSEPMYSDDPDAIELGECIADIYNCDDKWLDNVSIKDALEGLNEREKQILILRYYLGKTQIEVSEEVGISQAQVSRLEKNALKYIKKFFD
ncbi:MAG: RNA polymerase sporulation sigma factor SigG [Clostridia bacterium]|nr:RNA polymerase sporulation sigma factor SigG [Clostridia bacterium]